MAQRLERDLRTIIRNTPWFMDALRAVRSVARERTGVVPRAGSRGAVVRAERLDWARRAVGLGALRLRRPGHLDGMVFGGGVPMRERTGVVVQCGRGSGSPFTGGSSAAPDQPSRWPVGIGPHEQT